MTIAEKINKSKKVLNFWHKLNCLPQKEFDQYQRHFKNLFGGNLSNVEYNNGIITPVFK